MSAHGEVTTYQLSPEELAEVRKKYGDPIERINKYNTNGVFAFRVPTEDKKTENQTTKVAKKEKPKSQNDQEKMNIPGSTNDLIEKLHNVFTKGITVPKIAAHLGIKEHKVHYLIRQERTKNPEKWAKRR